MLVAMLVDLWASLIDTQANSYSNIKFVPSNDWYTDKLQKIPDSVIQ
jgi:hypothetical protein